MNSELKHAALEVTKVFELKDFLHKQCTALESVALSKLQKMNTQFKNSQP